MMLEIKKENKSKVDWIWLIPWVVLETSMNLTTETGLD